MKRILLLVSGLIVAFGLNAQTILTYKSHGLLPNEQNPMMLTKYLEPGSSGQNVTWDFSMLEGTNNFVGSIQSPSLVKGADRFVFTNTMLEEFGSYFFFNSNSNALEQFGYLSSNGSFALEYSKPFVKMRYPFSYNSFYSGDFEGTYFADNKEIGKLSGNYKVSGDGIGTLVLPEGKSYRNVLRVKEVKVYDQNLNGSKVKIEETAYRWYVNEHRFPILVFIKCNYTYDNGQTSSTTKAAFNSKVMTSIKGISDAVSTYNVEVFPNPYYERVNIKLQLNERAKVIVDVYDLIGKRIANLSNKYEEAGEYTYLFSAKEIGLAKGTYIVKVKVNNLETTRKILEL